MPAFAATATPEVPALASGAMTSDPAVDAYYASRKNAALWLTQGAASPAATALMSVLQRAPVDGFASGPAFAAEAQALLSRAQAGDPSAAGQADRLLSTAWVHYVQALQRPAAGMTYEDNWVRPRTQTPATILQLAAAAPSLADHVRSVSDVNPFYASLRDIALQQLQSTGTAPDARVLASLDRARVLPSRGRFVLVDAATARLWMIDNGQVADSMKVIVGKPGSQTPMLASAIYAATLNPYWNVPGDLVQKLIAPRVLAQGVNYLKVHHYELLSGFGDDAQPVDATDVDWKAVAQGKATIRVRQLPGPANSMGEVKFAFPNKSGIYLHDSPEKELFAKSQRDLSNGCIRLEDANRLGRWLMGREPSVASDEPEQRVFLPKPVPVFVTYLTAHADGGQLTLVDDIYGRDSQENAGARMVALH
ncbi:L,D-transpeptidase family protein [Sphingomonas sp. F9_3S_D5_B_2]